MSLLLNEDFTTYQLRLGYLQHIHDGVGERLINLNTSVVNNPAFRAAGWLPDNAAVRRCYSPPIPTTGSGEYFQAPRHLARRSIGVNLEDERGGAGGMVTGHQGSEDTIGPGGALSGYEARKRRRRKEQLEEDDSSDLSDDSEEEEKSAAHGIKFNKMPVRQGRSTSSPESMLKVAGAQAGEEGAGPAVNVISPSYHPPRRESLGQVEAIKQRARRDTATSSEMSSENELDPNVYTRKLPGRPAGKKTVMLSEKIQEEEQRDLDGEEEGESDLEDEEVGEASDLSDEFEVDDATGASQSPGLLGLALGARGASDDASPIKPPPNIPPAITPMNHSPRKANSKDALPKLPKLPPGRPMSTVVPPSLLTMALKGGSSSGEKAFQRFAGLSGKGEAQPLWIKIYAPFSEKPTSSIEVPLRRAKDGNPVTVAELIGLALWRYEEEDSKPKLGETDQTINRWTLRIVEDEEVDFDFPALVRTRPVTDFTSNNNRPPQRRARDKPWDEFGLVRATDEQFKENEELTPQFETSNNPPPVAPTPNPSEAQQSLLRPAPADRSTSAVTVQSTRSTTASFNPAYNPITGPTFRPTALRQQTGGVVTNNALDAPQHDNPQSTPRTGAPKTVAIQYTDQQTFSVSKLAIPTTADTYIAEIFDHACHRLGLEKGLYVLKVHGTQTVAPSDRTVEALGQKLHLDLVPRRFIGGDGGLFGLGLSGSPGSSSPNAPLELTNIAADTGAGGGKKKKAFGLHNYSKGPTAGDTGAALTSTTSLANLNPTTTTTTTAALGLGLDMTGGRRYNVLRKQPLSFAPSHPRTLIITPEYLQILPAAPDSLAAPTGKVTNVPMSSIVGVKVSRKHPKMVRVFVYREKETKRYDFECSGAGEAGEVVRDVRRGMEIFGGREQVGLGEY